MNKSIHIGNRGHNKEIRYLCHRVKMFFMLTQAPLGVNQIRQRNMLDVTSAAAVILS